MKNNNIAEFIELLAKLDREDLIFLDALLRACVRFQENGLAHPQEETKTDE